MSAEVFLAIDGGGTRTTAVLVDAAGQEQTRATAGTSNPSVIGLEAASSTLVGLIETIREQARTIDPFRVLWAGLAGFGRSADHQHVRAVLAPFAEDLRLTNDVELVLGGLRDRVGVAAIAGTGSIVAGRNAAGDFVRVGGWGHIFGDEGSGYDIGRQALRAVAEHADGRGPETDLTRRLFEELGVDNALDMIPKIYAGSFDKAAIADLARHPLDAAFHGDPVSIAIVQRASADLARMVDTAARRLGLSGTLPLALSGGILLHNLILRSDMIDRLTTSWEQIDAIVVVDPALTAARACAGHWGAPV